LVSYHKLTHEKIDVSTFRLYHTTVPSTITNTFIVNVVTKIDF